MIVSGKDGAGSDDSAEMRYLHNKRTQMGGYLPRRETAADVVPVSAPSSYAAFATAAAGTEMSTTMAVVRMLGNLLKDKELGPRIVPIVADEARTFGIYSSVGQRYEPEDIGSVLSYREAMDDQILEESNSEAGAIANWTAATTSYSVHGLAMLPFYIYYSNVRLPARGRRHLGGEGLQRQNGSSHHPQLQGF